mmetsp:Transcript_77878/g.174601  ORF Transcript_77878/g.174601 Transcript_77878/m.174601 type:complete len:213 (-) Transcript_77878:161-799(-)
MLEPRLWWHPPLRGRLHPIPTAIPMLAQAPYVLQRPVVGGPATKNNHHARRRTLSANLSRVVDPWQRAPCVHHGDLVPLERGALNIEYPDVALSLLPIVPTENYQQGLVEDHRVAVPAPGRWPQHRHAHPLRPLLLPGVEEEQLIRGETAAARGSAINDHLRKIDACGGMGGTCRRHGAFSIDPTPKVRGRIEQVGIRGDSVPAGVSCRSTK